MSAHEEAEGGPEALGAPRPLRVGDPRPMLTGGTRPLLPGGTRPLLIGHRGAPGYRPEHTASSYRLAIAQGADAVEPDVVVSRDGVLVVRHENEISGTTNVADRPEFAGRVRTKMVDGRLTRGWFAEDFDWAELQTLRCRERLPELRPQSARFDGGEPMLRLRDLLALLDGAERPVGAVIELKHAQFFADRGIDLVALLLAELTAAGWADRPDRLTVECFELGPLLRLRAAGLRASLVLLIGPRGVPADEVPRRGGWARTFGWYRSAVGLAWLVDRVDGVSLDKATLLTDPGVVERAHANGLTVFAWTLRPENHFLEPPWRTDERGGGERSGGDRCGGSVGNWRSEWRRVLASGVDRVFADTPDLARTAIDEWVGVAGGSAP